MWKERMGQANLFGDMFAVADDGDEEADLGKFNELPSKQDGYRTEAGPVRTGA
jgi:hypothetical protein